MSQLNAPPTTTSTAPSAKVPSPTSPTHPPSANPRHQVASISLTDIIPLDSPLRTHPIHPTLPGIKLPVNHDQANINPLTLQSFSDDQLKGLGYEKLRADLESRVSTDTGDNTNSTTSNTASGVAPPPNTVADIPVNANGLPPAGLTNKAEIERAKEEAVRLLRERLAEREAKEREVDREIEEKEKIREVERKVYRKKMGLVEKEKGKDGP